VEPRKIIGKARRTTSLSLTSSFIVQYSLNDTLLDLEVESEATNGLQAIFRKDFLVTEEALRI